MAIALPVPLAFVAVSVKRADSLAPRLSAVRTAFGSFTDSVRGTFAFAEALTAESEIVFVFGFDVPFFLGVTLIAPVSLTAALWLHRAVSFRTPRLRFGCILAAAIARLNPTFDERGVSVQRGRGTMVTRPLRALALPPKFDAVTRQRKACEPSAPLAM